MAGRCRLSRLGHFRFEASNLVQHYVGAKDEIAAVPEIVPCDVITGRRSVGFLDKSVDGERRMAVEFAPWPDIAIVGRRTARTNSEGDDHAFPRTGSGLPTRATKLFWLSDDVVRSDNEEDGSRIPRGRDDCGNGDRGAGVAACRL